MLADVPFWLKVRSRGIDIAASVIASTISAAIIAIIATFTWRWKRNRDLRFEEDKQRQQQRLAEEFAETESRRTARERELADLIRSTQLPPIFE
jgi:type VI protein secretion system component VasK